MDEVVTHIRSRLSAQDFRLDFIAYGRALVSGKKTHTRLYYETALNALEKFNGSPVLDINAITRRMLLDFAASVGEVKAARHLAKLAYIYREARTEYNDEDAGLIRIPRQPFTNLPKIQRQGKEQKPLPPETMQALIDYQPRNEWERITLAVFLLSFCTMGANLADLYAQKGPVSGSWKYNRRKTGVYVEVRLNQKIDTFVAMLQDGTDSPWWLPELHRYGSADTATRNINKWLDRIAQRLGVPSFRFYAARKTWGTTARRIGIEKATVDDALAHVGDYKMTDIYAEKNWDLTAQANEKVLALFDWTNIGQNPGAQEVSE